jgi:asparagine synthase (glutamine-hydrolysing)
MITIRLSYNRGYKWFAKGNIFVKGFIFTPDNQLLREENLITYFSDIHSFSDFQTKLQQANGLFAVVIKRGDTLWAAIDSTRSFPLFYYHKKDFLAITDNPEQLKFDAISMVLDENSAILLSYSGFITGSKTLLKDVFQLVAGESLCYEDDQIKKEFHTEFLTKTFSTHTRKELKEELKAVLDGVGKRMVKALGGRPVAIPLSGGFDSRLMAYLLRKNDYPSVFCYTFGKNNNVELKNAKRVAENLRYKFYFVNYEKYVDKSLTEDPVFREYIDYSTNYSCRFEEQHYYAVKEFVDLQIISKDTVFIPGDSGAIAGHLLEENMAREHFSFIEHALTDVFSLIYPSKKELKLIRKEIDLLNNHKGEYPSYLVYENWRFQGTTALAFNTAKLWDFFGYEYLLPLWDKELFNFFVQVPFQHKYDKNLYKETLVELFTEFNIYFPGEELYPSAALLKKVSFRSKLKKHFPFLKRFINIWKNDHLCAQQYAEGFIKELKEANSYKKMLSFNGISSAWYLLQVRKQLKSSGLILFL